LQFETLMSLVAAVHCVDNGERTTDIMRRRLFLCALAENSSSWPPARWKMAAWLRLPSPPMR
jgi:hypothetical protein